MWIAAEYLQLLPERTLLIRFPAPMASAVRIAPWGAGMSGSSFVDGGWQDEHPSYRTLPLLHLESDGPGKALLSAFRREIPAGARKLAAHALDLQLPMLRLCRRCPELLDLARTAPALSWLLVDHVQQRGVSANASRQLLRESRPALAQRVLGLDASAAKAAVKLLSKIELPARLDAAFLAALRGFLAADGAWRRFRHMERIPAAWVRHQVPEWMGDRYLRALLDVSEPTLTRHLSAANALANDALELSRQLRHPEPLRTLQRCAGAEQVSRLHDRWADDFGMLTLQDAGDASFPPPPIPGTDTIQPICSAIGLQIEGRRMHHCVGIYGDRVRRGESYVYRVTEPERTTLELRWGEDGWYMAQLVRACNRPAGRETVTAAARWLEAWRTREEESAR